jgi:hypothetical protein
VPSRGRRTFIEPARRIADSLELGIGAQRGEIRAPSRRPLLDRKAPFAVK